MARTPAIPTVKVAASESTVATETVKWQGATLRELMHYEFSALGVAADAGGAFVADAPAASPAFAAGLRKGDFIQRVNDRAVRNAKEFLEAVRVVPAGGKIQLSLTRNQQPATVELTLPVTTN